MGYVVWLGIAAVMALIEVVSSGLITMWFVLGALAAFIANILGASFIIQLVVFLVVSIISLIALRPLVIKNRKNKESDEPSLIGSSAVVCEAIDNDHMVGRVETPDRMTWAAQSVDDSKIEVGAIVTVVKQESVKLIVERKAL